MTNIKPRSKPIKRRVKKLKRTRRKLHKAENLAAPQDRSWISPDAEYCNTIHAGKCIGRSVSRLQSMRCEGVGPKFIKLGRRVIYRIADLNTYIEGGSPESSST